ncbi:Y-family DNA polymerase [Aquabacterium sp.]|uniref:Y-family DNA polymerase n=1 Tax=Aquabacterium sp. TaxID=1872578 RepID=UPI003D6D5BB1
MLLWIALLPGEAPSSSSDGEADSPLPAEDQSLDALALAWWALQFTPRVALLDEGVVMEVQASQRLFGGSQNLKRQVVQGAASLGWTRWACGPTALATLARARHGRTRSGNRLDQLPLSTISAVQAHAATLSRLGCQTLGDVRRLPRHGMSRRFGAALLLALDQAQGLKPEAFEWVQLPPRFDARLELPGRVDNAASLVFAARRLLQQLCAWLAGLHSGVRTLTLRWQLDYHRRDAARQGELVMRLSEASRNLDRLHRLLAEHLSRTSLGGPVGDLSLHVDEVEALTIDSDCLFQEHNTLSLGTGPDALASPAAQRQQREALSTLLDRLSARLGKDHVKQAVVQADHRIEHTQRWVPAVDQLPGATGAPAASASSQATADHPQPAWLLAEPQALNLHPLQLLAGPHRVESGWWDGQSVARDYYLAHNDQAGLLWVFRERHVQENQSSPLFLHGIFS